MPNIRPADLIRKYYAKSPKAHSILLDHSRLVTRKAIIIARDIRLSAAIDVDFIAEAAMLHDIGMIYTHLPELFCYGDLPYLAHGIKGAEILKAEGLPRHARVCERHIGIGLTAAEIIAQALPLPRRNMLPETLEEKIICFADLFFSKNSRDRQREKRPAEVRAGLLHYGPEKGQIFDVWLRLFTPGDKTEP
ncbi:MAG: HD domain-containing protein [Geopsychrobacter sp.]|nr:HD domain-containing protein [Geopsychrobacter sp.]